MPRPSVVRLDDHTGRPYCPTCRDVGQSGWLTRLFQRRGTWMARHLKPCVGSHSRQRPHIPLDREDHPLFTQIPA